MIIWISGPTGAGKSTLAQALRNNDWLIHGEFVSNSDLANFQSNPKQNCYRLQKKIIEGRRHDWDGIASAANIAVDRTVGEDFEVFCRLHHEHGFLSDDEMQSLRAQADNLLSYLPKPDLIIFLSADPPILVDRLAGKKCPQLIIDTLPRQIELYEQWAKRAQSPILRLDTSKSEPVTFSKLIGAIRNG